MKVRYILAILLASVCLTACDDYTEENFGTPEKLFQATQVNQLQVKLTPGDYELIAANADNQLLADTTDSTGKTSEQLRMLNRKKRFHGNITPEAYLPAVMRNLIGNTQYYTITDGTTVVVTCEQEVETGNDVNAYVLATGPLTSSDVFLIAPKGEEQVVANMNTPNLYLTGSELSKPRVSRMSNDAIMQDPTADSHLYSIEKDGDRWLLANAGMNYIYLVHATITTDFQYIDDLGDIEEGMYPQWTITYDSATYTYDIVNPEMHRVLRYDADNDYVVAVPDTLADEYTPLELYRAGHANDVKTTKVSFTFQKGKWVPGSGYMRQYFRGSGKSSKDAEVIFDTYGWSIENEGSIGDLNFVWQYDSRYGMKASAFLNSTKYPAKSWLISPAFDLSEADKPILTFSQTQRYVGEPASKYLQVWISTNYQGRGMREQAKWKNITKFMQGGWPDGSNWNFIRDTIPLAEYVGESNVNIAFKYISDADFAATWEVDSIVVDEPK